MEAARLIQRARLRAGLSKRELARRAKTSPAAIVAYESGSREPSYETLRRILDAAGFESRLTLMPTGPRPSRAVAGDRLRAVLDLAEHLPKKRAPRRLSYPRLPQ